MVVSDLNFNCPHCNQSLEAPEEMLGQAINCPSCNGSIQLPQSTPKPEVRPPPSPKVVIRKPLAPPPPPPPVPIPTTTVIGANETSGLAVASMVIGILAILGGWFWSGAILPILAIIFGHVSLYKIKKNSPRLKGKGFSVTGLTLGYVSLVIAIIFGLIVTTAVTAIDQSLKQIKRPPIQVRR
jgi:hypothetical protein